MSNTKSQLKLFKEQTGITLESRDGKPYCGGYLDLRGTGITSLPDGLTVGGYLDLRGTGITSLPDGLTVGGSLDLEGTGITSLPDGLTVGGSLYLRGTGITGTSKVIRKLSAESKKKIASVRDCPKLWEWNGKRYIKADGMFTVIDSHRGHLYCVHKLTVSNKQFYLVTDGENHWAHGDTLQEARADMLFKINDRDTSAYKKLTLDDTLTFEEAIAAYRTITGACSTGTRDYIENRLPKPHKAEYTIREIIDLTRGEYKAEVFKQFFNS